MCAVNGARSFLVLLKDFEPISVNILSLLNFLRENILYSHRGGAIKRLPHFQRDSSVTSIKALLKPQSVTHTVCF